MHRMAVRFLEGGKSNEKVQRCASGRNASLISGHKNGQTFAIIVRKGDYDYA